MPRAVLYPHVYSSLFTPTPLFLFCPLPLAVSASRRGAHASLLFLIIHLYLFESSKEYLKRMTGRIQPLIFKGDGSMVVDHPSYIHKPVSGQTLRVSSHLFAVRVLTSVYQATQPCHLTVLLCHEHTNTHTHKRE